MKTAVVKSEVKISMDDIIKALPKLKRNKAPGPDNISAEAFLYGMPRLVAHIGIIFSWFLDYGYLPRDFTRSIIILLVKNKSGDLTDGFLLLTVHRDCLASRGIMSHCLCSTLFSTVLLPCVHIQLQNWHFSKWGASWGTFP